jgi:hypothetical protein
LDEVLPEDEIEGETEVLPEVLTEVLPEDEIEGETEVLPEVLTEVLPETRQSTDSDEDAYNRAKEI